MTGRSEYLLALSKSDVAAMRRYLMDDHPGDEERAIVEEWLRQPSPRVVKEKARHQPAPMKEEKLL